MDWTDGGQCLCRERAEVEQQMGETNSSESYRITKLGTTNDTLTSRGGLAFFVKYVERVGVLGLLLAKFEGIKKSAKGVSIGNLFLQALYFFFDGTSRHVSYFDELKKDSGYTAVVKMPDKQVASSQRGEAVFRRVFDLQSECVPLGAERIVCL